MIPSVHEAMLRQIYRKLGPFEPTFVEIKRSSEVSELRFEDEIWLDEYGGLFWLRFWIEDGKREPAWGGKRNYYDPADDPENKKAAAE